MPSERNRVAGLPAEYEVGYDSAAAENGAVLADDAIRLFFGWFLGLTDSLQARLIAMTYKLSRSEQLVSVLVARCDEMEGRELMLEQALSDARSEIESLTTRVEELASSEEAAVHMARVAIERCAELSDHEEQ